MIDIKVYNAEQIGGCFTVITTSKAKIMIDYGLPLPGAKAEQEDFDWEHDTVDAVFITHYHGDHVGKILDIPAPIPIYMGRATKEFMLNIHKALIRVPKFKEEQRKWVELLKGNRIHEVEENNPITEIKGLKVTPYSVDHSAYDAYMYLIEADGKVVLHTGDFRGHGYRGSIMLDAIKNHVHENGRKVDYLITEGTMMGDRIKENVKTEEEMQEEATNIFREHKYVFLVISSTNFDSLTSFYKAADENDMRMYCYNYYFFNQLRTFSRIAGSHNPEYQFEHIYTVDFEKKLGHEFWDEDKTQEELMREHGFLCVIKAEDKYNEWIKRFSDKKPLVIYSMWDGYINKKKGKEAYNKEWADFFKPYKKSKQYKDLHTSGHATAKMIAEVINAVAPLEEIIPMHTENVKGFRELDIDERYKRMLRVEGEQSMGNKKEKNNVLFGRKNDYDAITIQKVQTLIEASKKIGYPILVIPGVDCIYCYYAGYSFAEISNEVKFVLGDGYKKYFENNDWNEMKKDYELYLYNSNNNWSNLKKVLKGVSQAQPRDYERHTQHEIAINNIKFSNSSYSVCGFETAIPEHYFAEKKKPEADLVVLCPDEHRIILVEFKCRISSLSGSCGVVKHCTDYIDIIDRHVEIGFIKEMVKAYNLMNKLYGGSADELDVSDITKIDIAFLITGSSSKDNDKNAKGKIKESDNKRAINMIKKTKKVPMTKKKELGWYWCENYKDVEFTGENFLSFQSFEN